ncbi:MAG: hypothetical protein K2H19_06075 [Ruminococcus sp.]|nr:hypothetical protein [Ruminococcus sp.]
MPFIDNIILLLTSNLILTQALGTSTLFIAAENRKKLFGTALAITFFTTSGSVLAYFINNLMPESLENLTLLFYTLAIGLIYVIVLTLLYFTGREKFRDIRKYVHVSAFNCAVMGTLFTVTETAEIYPERNNINDFMLSGLQAGAGFILAVFILTVAYKHLTSSDVPASFRGFPAMLVYLGIISMAVYALK